MKTKQEAIQYLVDEGVIAFSSECYTIKDSTVKHVSLSDIIRILFDITGVDLYQQEYGNDCYEQHNSERLIIFHRYAFNFFLIYLLDKQHNLLSLHDITMIASDEAKYQTFERISGNNSWIRDGINIDNVVNEVYTVDTLDND